MLNQSLQKRSLDGRVDVDLCDASRDERSYSVGRHARAAMQYKRAAGGADETLDQRQVDVGVGLQCSRCVADRHRQIVDIGVCNETRNLPGRRFAFDRLGTFFRKSFSDLRLNADAMTAGQRDHAAHLLDIVIVITGGRIDHHAVEANLDAGLDSREIGTMI